MIIFMKNSENTLGLVLGGGYDTNSTWKENHQPLQNNESSSLGKLNNLIRNLNRSKSLEAYDKFMQIQITEREKC